MTETTNPTNTNLASLLEGYLKDWEQARKPQEQKLLECYNDAMRIPRDDDTKDTGTARSRKAKGLFIGSTRNKIRSARAKINDALFGNGKFPFDTMPSNEKLAPFADLMEDIIVDQLERGRIKDVLTDGVDLLATYGTGFLFGPFVRREVLTETTAVDAGGSIQIEESKFEFDLPYFELGNTLDVYPDSEARDVSKALGVFWVTMESKHTVSGWKADKNYKNIDQALVAGGDSQNETGSEIAAQQRGNVDFWHQNDRIKVARYFGKVPASALKEGGDTSSDGELVDVIVIMAGGVVVKVDKSPYGGKNPTHRCVYESVANEMWGVGVAENNAPHQKTVNAAFRLFMEGKGMALLGTKAVDRSAFLPTEDFKKFPGKVYKFKPGLSPEEKKAAIIEFVEPDVTNGWLDVIRASEQFSDDDTGITKYTQGDDSRNLNKTAAGISMIMSASSLPMKEVIQHVDSMWIERMIECYIEWNLKYLEVDTVQKIHGDEAAEKWAAIKQFGKSSFMSWKASGTKSFMTKEVLTNKIMTFINLVTAHPQFADKVDFIELLEQAWSLMEIGGESPILKDEGEKIPPNVKNRMQQMQEMIQKLEQAIIAAHQEVEKLESGKAEKASELKVKQVEANTKAYQAITQRLQVLGPLMAPQEVEQLVAETKREAMEQPDPGMDPSLSMGVPQPMMVEEPQAPLPEPPAEMPMQEQPSPPSAGFSLPEAPV